MNNYHIIIPARLQSTRLPQKLLQKIGDKTVIEHTVAQAKQTNAKQIIVACDDERIAEIFSGTDTTAVLTRTDHESGTDRLAECVEKLGLADDDVIVNLQGDEPFMPPQYVNLCADTLFAGNTPVSTLACRIDDADDISNPNAVKVVRQANGNALYFSRAGIPFNRDSADLNIAEHYFHHLGIYGYRVHFLKTYSSLSASPLEQIEKLEQLRVLWHGYQISVGIVDSKPPKGIDTDADLAAANAHFARIISQNK